MMNNEVSRRLSILRFPLIVGVVYIHNFSTTINLTGAGIGVSEPSAAVNFIRYFISDGIARVSVPLFLMISGFLFFSDFQFTRQHYIAKARKRVNTLLIPFLFWNFLTLSFYAIGERTNATRRFFTHPGRPAVGQFGVFDYFNSIIGITTHPIAYQFWFIRDLMVAVLLVPVFWFLIKSRFAAWFVSVLLALWFFDIWPVTWPNSVAISFFFLGAWLATSQADLSVPKSVTGLLATVFLVSLIYCSGWHSGAGFAYVYHLIPLSGVVLAWSTTAWILHHARGLELKLTAWSRSAFFVYAVHEPLLIISRKLVYSALVPKSTATLLAIYLLLPICLITFLMLLYLMIARVVPHRLLSIAGLERS